MKMKTATFLLVEDDDIDVKAIKRELKKAKIVNPVRLARDGVEALEILRGTNNQEQIRSPYLILLDINMPRMNGIEFLKEIRSDDALKSSIIFVLTTSTSDEDITSAYNHNIAGYIPKCNASESFATAVNMLDSYWKVVEFPVE